MIRYAVIGTGMMGIEHIQNINLIPDAEVVAVADPYPRSQQWARRAGGEELRVFDDYLRLLSDVDVDAIVVATPNHTHASVLRDLFTTDRHILCEKPLCTTLEDCRWVVEQAAQHGGVFWVGMEYRYSPPVARFVREVHAGRAGEVKMFSIKEHRLPFLKKVDDWNRFNRNSGGTLVEKSCHHFDLMRHVLQAEPTHVYATGGTDVNHLDEEYGGEHPDIMDNAFVTVEFNNGTRAMHDLCMFAEASRNSQELCATGSEGKVECLMPQGDVVLGKREPRSLETITVPVDEIVLAAGFHHGATYFELLGFQKAIRQAAAPAVSATDGLRAVAMGIAAHRSIDEKRVVAMSEFGL
jgi:myo-inositol 2-dehydrogenase / D-chiro-inositol 1-dehydrogenase